MKGPRVERCAFCGSPAEHTCTRGAERYFQVRVGEIASGDRICRMNELAPKAGSHAVVESIEKRGRWGSVDRDGKQRTIFWPGAHYLITITIYRAGKKPRQKSFEANPQERYRKAMPDLCGAPICDNCAQDPSDEHKYCPAHWTRVESVAA